MATDENTTVDQTLESSTSSLPEIKSTEVVVHEVENDAFITNINGWRIRVHFAYDIDKEKVDKLRFGQYVDVKYEGDLEDVHSLDFKKYK